jgi:SAM-dependent methyltransferase
MSDEAYFEAQPSRAALILAGCLAFASLILSLVWVRSPRIGAVFLGALLIAVVFVRLDHRVPLLSGILALTGAGVSLALGSQKFADRLSLVGFVLLVLSLVLGYGISARVWLRHGAAGSAGTDEGTYEQVEGLSAFGRDLFAAAAQLNLDQIRHQLRTHAGGDRILDLGCWDGETASYYAPDGLDIYGVELSLTAMKQANARGVRGMCCSLEDGLPVAGASFDLVSSNQVIEHLADTDTFLAESYRVLRPGGWVVVSTENMSSWHNIVALVFGWQAFSLTNVTQKRYGIGNPMALLRDAEPREKGWEHLRIFSFRGLRELLEAHGFVEVSVVGAGYYPLPSTIARFDPRHSAFITAVGRKPTPTGADPDR